MESVGQKLRATRLQQGSTLEEISEKTRISIRTLNAIEGDDVSAISSAFFYRSFVKQFAQHLRLDFGELAASVQEISSAIPEPLMPGQVLPGQVEAMSLPKVPAIRPSNKRTLRSLFSFASLIVMLVACSSVYAMWQNSRQTFQFSKLRDAATRALPAKASARQVPTQQSAAVITPRPAPLQVAPATSPANTVANAFEVQLSAVEPTWLSIAADGRETFTGILEAAETKMLEGRERGYVRTGNAGGLNIVFNGKSIGALGRRGQVRTIVFTKTGYETLESAPAPAASLTFTGFIPNAE